MNAKNPCVITNHEKPLDDREMSLNREPLDSLLRSSTHSLIPLLHHRFTRSFFPPSLHPPFTLPLSLSIPSSNSNLRSLPLPPHPRKNRNSKLDPSPNNPIMQESRHPTTNQRSNETSPNPITLSISPQFRAISHCPARQPYAKIARRVESISRVEAHTARYADEEPEHYQSFRGRRPVRICGIGGYRYPEEEDCCAEDFLEEGVWG